MARQSKLKRKRERQKARAKQRRRQKDNLLTRGLVGKLADPITSRGILGEAIRKHQQP